METSIVHVGQRGMAVSTMSDMLQLAAAVVKARLAPRGLETQEAVLVAMQMGMELGLTPMASLRSIAVINGKASIYGDLAKALVESSGQLEYCRESIVGEKDEMAAVCQVKRKGRPEEVTQSFSVADARRAGLWGKQGPWSQYPKRMLQMRARMFALRDAFPDVLQGIPTVEESGDIDGGAMPEVTVQATPAVTTDTEDLNKQLLGDVQPEQKALPAAEPVDTPEIINVEPTPEPPPAVPASPPPSMPNPCTTDWIADYALSKSPGWDMAKVKGFFRLHLPKPWAKLAREQQQRVFDSINAGTWFTE